jgi:hypothetical protein
LSYFENYFRRRIDTEDSEIPDNELIEIVLRDVGLKYIPKRAIRVQKYYMRQPRGLYMGLNTSVQQFVERLTDLNRYLLYFPEENPKQLDHDEIIEILHQTKAKNPEWHEEWLIQSLIFLKCLMKNLFLISSVWKTWRRLGALTIPTLSHY